MTIDEYYKNLSKQGRAAIRERKARGEVMHKAPYGFKNVRDKSGTSLIAPDATEFPLLIRAHELRTEGRSYRAIAKELWFHGMKSRSGRVVGPSGMRRILAQTFFAQFSEYDPPGYKSSRKAAS